MARTKARRKLPKRRPPADPAHQLALGKNDAKKHGIRHVDRIQATGRVICRGHKRPVYLINNSYVLPTGHNTDREQALADLGGKPCRCLTALRELQLCRASKLPITFSGFVAEARKKRVRRVTQARMDRNRELSRKYKPGDVGIMQRKVQLLLRLKCGYKTTNDPRCTITVRNAIGRVQAHGGIMVSIAPDLIEFYLVISLGHIWRKAIAPAGLAVVDGHLIMNVMEPRAKGGHVQLHSADDARKLINKAYEDHSFLEVVVLREEKYSGARRFSFDKYKSEYMVESVRFRTDVARLFFDRIKPRLLFQ